MNNDSKTRQSNWLFLLIAILCSLIVTSSIYVMQSNDNKTEEILLATDIERLTYEIILSEKNTLIHINNLTKVNELHARANTNVKNITKLLDYIDKNFQENIREKSKIARQATLQYKALYDSAVLTIKELQEIKHTLEEQGSIAITEVSEYVQDRLAAHKTNKNFKILQKLNTSMRIWEYAVAIRLNQKEYIQTHKETTIHTIKINFDFMQKDMEILQNLAETEFELLKTKRFMEAVLLYQQSSNQWLAMNQHLDVLLLEMEGLFETVTKQAKNASEESTQLMHEQHRIMLTVILAILCLLLALLLYTSGVLRRKNAE